MSRERTLRRLAVEEAEAAEAAEQERMSADETNRNTLTESPDITERVVVSDDDLGYGTVSKYLLFEIVDTGIGIAPDKIDTLFAPFKQAQRFAGGKIHTHTCIYIHI